jgi:ring-1,2-phenylacetyl-CoA epoxidase subunit PaaC
MTGPAGPTRLETRAIVIPDVPHVDRGAVEPHVRDALAELLLTLADDEFVLGFWDSEWTGIAPMLEEDVAFSSLAQDELGHARVYYQLLAALTEDDADRIAFGRQPHEYRHASLLDHPRTDWAFSVARRWIYDTADAVRLHALRESSWAPLAEIVAKIRREERYHLLHMDTWMRRLAEDGSEGRSRLDAALLRLRPDAGSVFAPLVDEDVLLDSGILAEPMEQLARRWAQDANAVLARLGFEPMGLAEHPAPTRGSHGPAFEWLWGEFTSVHRSEEGATW